MPVIAFFFLLPLIEIALFASIGAWLGVGTTLLLVMASSLLGYSVLRALGRTTAQEVTRALQQMRDPAQGMAHGVLQLLAGVLLLVPGFLTSAIGLLLLIPPVRGLVMALAARNMRGTVILRQNGAGQWRNPQSDTIDGEFTEIEPPKRPTHRPSGWTQH